MSTVTVSCAFISFVLAYVPVFAKGGLARKLGKDLPGVDFSIEPRDAQDKVLKTADEASSSFIRRCIACHANQLECLPWFYASLVFAWLVHLTTGPTGQTMQSIDAVALTYTIARFFYTVFYIGSTHKLAGALRSTMWMFCVIACSYLFISAISWAPKPNY